MVRQYDKAEGLLLTLYNIAPYNSSLNIQLATLYEIINNVEKSQLHRRYVKKVSSDGIRLSILESISRRLCEIPEPSLETNVEQFVENMLPEDVGLARCTNAFLKIANSQPSDTIAMLEEVSFVDRIVEDLSYILRFHALAVNNLNAPSDQQRRIYMIAKRGDKSLRYALDSIRRGDFHGAEKFEADLLLRAA